MLYYFYYHAVSFSFLQMGHGFSELPHDMHMSVAKLYKQLSHSQSVAYNMYKDRCINL